MNSITQSGDAWLTENDVYRMLNFFEVNQEGASIYVVVSDTSFA